MVYITEAHASDVWPMGFAVEWTSPKSLEQRKEYAAICSKDMGLQPGFKLLVDGMDNAFNFAFGSWPTGYYVVRVDGTLVYLGQPEESEASYDVELLFTFLRKAVSSSGCETDMMAE